MYFDAVKSIYGSGEGTETASLLRPEANDIIIRVNDVSELDYAHAAENLGAGTVLLVAHIGIQAHSRTEGHFPIGQPNRVVFGSGDYTVAAMIALYAVVDVVL
jgi:hypothetical protein